MTLVISESDILQALRDAMVARPDGEGATITELVERLGVGPERVRVTVKRLIGEGRMVCGKGHRIWMDGRRGVVPVYLLVPKTKPVVLKKRS
jgi:hypothetical protein